MLYMFLSLIVLAVLYAGSVAVMVSGLASAKPETAKDAAFAEQLRRRRGGSRQTVVSSLHAV
jgi:hypothetical protein